MGVSGCCDVQDEAYKLLADAAEALEKEAKQAASSKVSTSSNSSGAIARSAQG